MWPNASAIGWMAAGRARRLTGCPAAPPWQAGWLAGWSAAQGQADGSQGLSGGHRSWLPWPSSNRHEMSRRLGQTRSAVQPEMQERGTQFKGSRRGAALGTQLPVPVGTRSELLRGQRDHWPYLSSFLVLVAAAPRAIARWEGQYVIEAPG